MDGWIINYRWTDISSLDVTGLFYMGSQFIVRSMLLSSHDKTGGVMSY